MISDIDYLNDNSMKDFSEHVVEHLYFEESKFLLKEICRVIKKIVFLDAVPGLDIYIDNYINKKR